VSSSGSSTNMPRDYYDVLGVEKRADKKAIEKA